MQFLSTYRRFFLLLVPFTIMVLELAHPVDWSGHVHGAEVVARDPQWWTILHITQLPLFGLLAAAVLLLTWDLQGRAVWISRAGVGLFLVFYSAHDSITGIASGIIVWEAQSLEGGATPPYVESLVNSLFLGGGPYSFIPVLGMLGWVMAMGGAATALSKAGVSLGPVALMVVSAVAFGVTHEPPFGPLGMAALFLAVGLIEYAPHLSWRSCPVREHVLTRSA